MTTIPHRLLRYHPLIRLDESNALTPPLGCINLTTRDGIRKSEKVKKLSRNSGQGFPNFELPTLSPRHFPPCDLSWCRMRFSKVYEEWISKRRLYLRTRISDGIHFLAWFSLSSASTDFPYQKNRAFHQNNLQKISSQLMPCAIILHASLAQSTANEQKKSELRSTERDDDIIPVPLPVP